MKLVFKIAVTASVIGALFISSCKPKEIDPKNEGIQEFLPVNTQNWWLYEASDNTIFKRYYTGRDTIIDNFEYNYFEQVDTVVGTIVKEFYAKFSGYYYTLLKVNDEGTIMVKAIVLNENPKVGDTWTNEGSFEYNNFPFNAKVSGEVISVNETAVVNGVTIDGIVTVKSRLEAQPPASTWLDCGTVVMKIKKGVGIIAEDYDFHVGTWVNKTYNNWLLNYHIVE